jgi:hypothetical protein
MSGQPVTRYTRAGDVSIAYQVVGDGPADLVFFPGWFSHMGLQPLYRHYIDDHIVRLDALGRDELADAFRSWRQQLHR